MRRSRFEVLALPKTWWIGSHWLTRATWALVLLMQAGAPAQQNGDLAEQGLRQIEAIEAAFQRAIDRVRPSVVSVFIADRQALMRSEMLAQQGFRTNRQGLDFDPVTFGTGVVLKKEGIVATCYHVVRSALDSSNDLEILVATSDGESRFADVYAADPRSDLVALRLRQEKPIELHPITLGDGSKLALGQFVLAVGNPFGIAWQDGATSASFGIISNIRRQPAPSPNLRSSDSILIHGRSLIQTDARLNMGSSGAAVVNMRGELVGIGMALAAAVGYETPGGFALPIDVLTRRVLETLAEGREMEYGFIGIKFDPSRTQIVPGEEGPRFEGARVLSVELPAARAAGLMEHDVIIELNGEPIRDQHDLILRVGSLPAGSSLRTKVRRGNAEADLQLTLAKFPLAEEPIVTNKRPLWNGMRVDYLSTLINPTALAFGETLPAHGVAVRVVEPNSAAAEKGLKPRQIVLQVNGTKINDPDQFDKIVAESRPPVRLLMEGGVEHVFDASEPKNPKP